MQARGCWRCARSTRWACATTSARTTTSSTRSACACTSPRTRCASSRNTKSTRPARSTGAFACLCLTLCSSEWSGLYTSMRVSRLASQGRAPAGALDHLERDALLLVRKRSEQERQTAVPRPARPALQPGAGLLAPRMYARCSLRASVHVLYLCLYCTCTRASS